MWGTSCCLDYTKKHVCQRSLIPSAKVWQHFPKKSDTICQRLPKKCDTTCLTSLIELTTEVWQHLLKKSDTVCLGSLTVWQHLPKKSDIICLRSLMELAKKSDNSYLWSLTALAKQVWQQIINDSNSSQSNKTSTCLSSNKIRLTQDRPIAHLFLRLCLIIPSSMMSCTSCTLRVGKGGWWMREWAPSVGLGILAT